VQDGVGPDQHRDRVLAALKEEVDRRGLALALGLFDQLDARVAAAEFFYNGRGAIGAAADHNHDLFNSRVVDPLVQQAGQAVAHVGRFVDRHDAQAAVNFVVSLGGETVFHITFRPNRAECHERSPGSL
jgi:hypothetical protein